MNLPKKIDINLKAWATVRELEYIDAIETYGEVTKAAAVLKVARGSIHSAMVNLKKRAAAKGYAPEHDMTKPTAEGFAVSGTSTLYDAAGNLKIQWVKTKADDAARERMLKEFAATLAEQVQGLAAPIPAPVHCSDSLLCVLPFGDPHFGLHAWWADAGEDFDLKAAERLTCAAIDRLIATSPNAATGLLLNLGDMYHSDNQKNQTQSGHQLDVDGRWAKVQQVGLRAMLYCLSRMLEKYNKVIFRINRGNHDGHSAYALALMISCYFHNEPRIEVDLSPATCWYYRHGKTLIGSTHGDTIKGPTLPGVMATDKAEDWGLSKHRYWYVGHVHHQDTKEYPGAVVEYFRTLAARDAWHTGQGYRAGRDMRLIVIDAEHGEVERHRCDIGMLG